ncbi:MAG: type II toxin-antitoxin system Phd/YefM family antitoxin [Gammaproteobacteria bacterium]|nr:type II toxin-antitoxin system Phd/YefM family antitoxin [Gammaproteobacteria bacterium]
MSLRVSVVELRNKMHDILKTLEHNGSITILYHGEEKGIIYPIKRAVKQKKIDDFDFFGMHAEKEISVEQEMEDLRGERY